LVLVLKLWEICAMAMRWFTRPEPTEVWEEPIASPIGDIEAVHRIRDICRAATDSAEKVGDARDSKQPNEVQRYEHAAGAAMEIVMKISDDLLRDSAVRQIIDLCTKADDLKTARILFRAIQAVSIREEVMQDHPQLR
jgi:hypothetical protein